MRTVWYQVHVVEQLPRVLFMHQVVDYKSEVEDFYTSQVGFTMLHPAMQRKGSVACYMRNRVEVAMDRQIKFFRLYLYNCRTTCTCTLTKLGQAIYLSLSSISLNGSLLK